MSDMDSRLQEMYKSQMSTLEEMGYEDKERNFEALKKSSGDINIALNYLINWSQE